MKRSVDRIFDAFNIADLQRLKVLVEVLKTNGYSLEDAMGYLDEYKRRTKNPLMFKVCPECKEPMNLFSVNDGPGNKVGGKWKSQWICICEYTEFSEEPPHVEVEKARRKHYGNR